MKETGIVQSTKERVPCVPFHTPSTLPLLQILNILCVPVNDNNTTYMYRGLKGIPGLCGGEIHLTGYIESALN